ncbi:dihydrofolate reductase [Brevibacillus reuszeri]|uniref:Dihydrofolate reductase n=1 Tax=Brevibacillus reuszeri TaxID=54915 RepID=A0A0K9YPV7_9BACL|nr:dihydrofolate reductase [Brevibacillus reuszeri]KNB70215.1 dihydrofolate reductase [Brevibacillus reuszeri]MED1859171.1 dihydrofolate reductase [Brevibacillus reuszeri]GED72339.1 dihydrofolate reductase [Brevibacillus reuszeri]
MISIIVAHDRNRLVGKDNSLPWSIPNDLQYFKQLTTTKIVIMGRKTYESLGRPLHNRTNIILTSNPDYQAEGCDVYNSIEPILEECKSHAEAGEEVFVIGGSSIYKQFLPYIDRLYITEIDHEFVGDTHFPEIDMSEWKHISNAKGVKDNKNPYDYYFKIYDKNIK